MGKLIFKYGVMGSHKTAEALIVRYQHIDRGHQVLLLKPDVDTRDDTSTVRKLRSRIGIEAECICLKPEDDVLKIYRDNFNGDENGRLSYPVVIIDEAQFLTEEHVSQLRLIADNYKYSKIYCYGLRTNSNGHLFTGSKRLFELADEIQEVESVCDCGRKAIINAKFNDGKVVVDDVPVDIGGDEKYKAMCFSCWNKLKKKSKRA